MQITQMKITEIQSNPNNPRTIRDEKFHKLVQSIKDFPEMLNIRPIVIDEAGVVLGGNMRLKAAKEAGLKEVPVIIAGDLTESQKKEFMIKDNASFGDWDWDILENDEWNAFDVGDWGVDTFKVPMIDFSQQEIETETEQTNTNIQNNKPEQVERTSLVDSFIVPPFTILDTNRAYWTQRKTAWKSLGIKSEIGREGNLLGFSQTLLIASATGMPPTGEKETIDDIVRRYILFTRNANQSRNQGLGASIPNYYHSKNSGMTDEEIVKEFLESDKIQAAGTSVFDPVLCEISYKWFCKDNGHIFDPFAGGSVRGIVAGKLGYKYTGIELRQEQVEANREQADEIVPENKPTYFVGSSEKSLEIAPGKYDLIFTCPPYYDLEVYSEDPEDLSTMEYKEFEAAYESIISQSVSMLNDDSFSVFVVGDVRDKDGYYLDFIGKTIAAHEKAGCRYYNQAIMVNSFGTAALRAGRQFNGGRKLTKVHQNVLVFFKGNPKNIKGKFQSIETGLDFETSGDTIFEETPYGEKITFNTEI